MRSFERDRGQVVPLVAALLVVVAAVAMGVARVGTAVVTRAQARTAADAAALAGAVEGETAAREVSEANGGRLEAFERLGDEAQVTVRVGDARATARAEILLPTGGPGGEGQEGLTTEMRAAIAGAEALLGRAIPITSGWRSRAQQEALWRARGTNPYPVARPGTSKHERGLAIDVPLSFVPALRSVAARVGLCWPLPASDPVHFELCPLRTPRERGNRRGARDGRGGRVARARGQHP